MACNGQDQLCKTNCERLDIGPRSQSWKGRWTKTVGKRDQEPKYRKYREPRRAERTEGCGDENEQHGRADTEEVEKGEDSGGKERPFPETPSKGLRKRRRENTQIVQSLEER